IMHDAAGLEQMRLSQILQRNVNSRRKARRRGSVARHFLQCANDFEFHVADLDRSTDRSMELEEKTFIDNGAKSLTKITRRVCRRCFHLAVKWKVAGERAQVDQSCSAVLRKNRHRAESYFA